MHTFFHAMAPDLEDPKRGSPPYTLGKYWGCYHAHANLAG